MRASALDVLLWRIRWYHCSHERAMVQHKTEEYLEEAQFNHQNLQDSGVDDVKDGLTVCLRMGADGFLILKIY